MNRGDVKSKWKQTGFDLETLSNSWMTYWHFTLHVRQGETEQQGPVNKKQPLYPARNFAKC